MRAKKYGAPSWYHDRLVRKHLFYNQRKGLSLDELREYIAGRCTAKYWEVHAVDVAENAFKLERKLVLTTPVYARAWDAVKDHDFEVRRAK